MTPGLLGAAVAALCYGTATILQAVGARRVVDLPPGTALRIRFVAGMPYAAGLVLDGLGFLASVAALRTLPLFLVESAIAASVGVTAVLAVTFLGARLRQVEVAALGITGFGLVVLALSASSTGGVALSAPAGWLLLAGVPALAAMTAAVSRRGSRTDLESASRRPGWGVDRARVALLAAGAGLGFGGVGIAARVLSLPPQWWRVLGDPVGWALVGYGVVATWCYALALAAGSVAVVAALTFAVETVVPSVIGLLWLGDRVRPGLGVVALLGFVATVGGCIVLAGRAEAPHRPGASGDRPSG